jgi:hypothetical protein
MVSACGPSVRHYDGTMYSNYENAVIQYVTLPFHKSIATDAPKKTWDPNVGLPDYNSRDILFTTASNAPDQKTADALAVDTCEKNQTRQYNVALRPCRIIVSDGYSKGPFEGNFDEGYRKSVFENIDPILAQEIIKFDAWFAAKREADKAAEQQRQQDEKNKEDAEQATIIASNPNEIWLKCELTGYHSYTSDDGERTSDHDSSITWIWKVDFVGKKIWQYREKEQELGAAYGGKNVTISDIAINVSNESASGEYVSTFSLRIHRLTLALESISTTSKPQRSKYFSTDHYEGPCKAINPPNGPNRRI